MTFPVREKLGRKAKGSAPTDGDNDFQPIAIRKNGLCVPAARYDFSIALHCNALAGIAKQFDQCGHGHGGRKWSALAVDENFHGARFYHASRCAKARVRLAPGGGTQPRHVSIGQRLKCAPVYPVVCFPSPQPSFPVAPPSRQQPPSDVKAEKQICESDQ